MMKPEQEKEMPFDEASGIASGADTDGVANQASEANPDSGAGEDPMEELRRQLELATQAAAENEDRYLRERADLENFKKRSQRERYEALRYAIEPLARDLIEVVDNLERALAHARATQDTSPVVPGVELVLKGALETLQRHGVERIEVAAGEAFDPSRHEAVMQVADASFAANQVVQQFLPGYRLHDRLLRAAQVSVASASGRG